MAVALQQQAISSSPGGGSGTTQSKTVNFGSDTLVGSLLVVVVHVYTSAGVGVSSISCTASGLTFLQAGSTTAFNAGEALFYAVNAPSFVHTNAITGSVTYSSASGDFGISLSAYEFTGFGGGTYDKQTTGTATNVAGVPTAGTFSPTQAGELIIASCPTYAAATTVTVETVGSGYAAGESATYNQVIAANQSFAVFDMYVLNGAAGSQTPTFGTSLPSGTSRQAAAWAFIPGTTFAGGTSMPPFFIGSKSG